MRFTVSNAGNPDPRNPVVEMGSYVSGEVVENEDHLILSRLGRRSFPCTLECKQFSLYIDAFLSTAITFRQEGPGRVHFATAEILPNTLIEYVESNPGDLEMIFRYAHEIYRKGSTLKATE